MNPTQLRLPGISRKQPAMTKRKESALQSQVIAVIGQMGYEVLEVGAGRPWITCPACQHRFAKGGWMGNSKGNPDCFAGRAKQGAWPLAAWQGIELKTPTRAIEPEQAELAGRGRTVIAYSPEEALRALLAMEDAMDAYRVDKEHRARVLDFLTMNKGRLE